MRRDEAAEALWAKAYERLGADPGGLLGGATNRGEAQVVRLSLLFAVLDCSSVIREAHLRAALAVGERIAAALVRLEEMGLARKILREGESRDGVAWGAASPFEMNEFYEQSCAGAGSGDENS